MCIYIDNRCYLYSFMEYRRVFLLSVDPFGCVLFFYPQSAQNMNSIVDGFFTYIEY